MPSNGPGEKAPANIIEALGALNQFTKPDVILLVRGGGSIEDLWAFNDESVARAVAASQAPVVSGIGHETDFTIADFAADARAPTPSAAAEIATPDGTQLALKVQRHRMALGRSLRDPLHRSRLALDALHAALLRASPRAIILNARQRIDDLMRRAIAAPSYELGLKREALLGLTQTLRAVGPASVLARGYAVVQRSDDRSVVRSIAQVSPGDALDVRVSDGDFGVEVTKKARDHKE